ncbi:hypothetical protein BDZ91DRAFT_778335 [Kalaharituber pfeilii]|nr:hypothetical protein BDZ91DRAFT_778335 [Kalaharituber pfeilii]
MATSETCTLGPAHSPKEASISTFTALLPEIKKRLIIMRHKHAKHDKDYFASVAELSDAELVDFDVGSLEEVRVGSSFYGLHIFGKVRLPKVEDGYIHVRMYVGEEDGEKVQKLHSIYLDKDGRAILKKSDKLEWFNE